MKATGLEHNSGAVRWTVAPASPAGWARQRQRHGRARAFGQKLGRTAGAIALGAALSGSLPAPVMATPPLSVRIAPLDVIGPARLAFDVSIVGLRPNHAETIEGRANVGEQSIVQPPTVLPPTVDHFRMTLDLRNGTIGLDGVAMAHFAPIPPPGDNIGVRLNVTVRQDGETATGQQTGVLVLPTVIVPGYLNEFWGPPPRDVEEVVRSGFRSSGPAPNLFWFAYRSTKLSLEQSGNALAAYVHDVVLRSTYAARINVVAYSSGGLPARWCLAFAPGWGRLVNKMFLVGVPNEGSLLSYIYSWYPMARLARTSAARSMLPSYPFWRPTPNAPWGVPAGAENRELEHLNAQPIPEGPQLYVYYGDQLPAPPNNPGTQAEITGDPPDARFRYGAGDKIVLTASALGLPINGGAGIPGFRDRLTAAVNLGPLSHFALMRNSVPRIVAILTTQPAADRGHHVAVLNVPSQDPVGARAGAFRATAAIFSSWAQAGFAASGTPHPHRQP
jgi:hypothetical protein